MRQAYTQTYYGELVLYHDQLQFIVPLRYDELKSYPLP